MTTGYRVGKNDKDILVHIEKYGFMTTDQCVKLYYNDINYPYDVARKRLRKMVDAGLIKKSIIRFYDKVFDYYYINTDYNHVTYHAFIVMNYLVELMAHGVEEKDIRYFKKEHGWMFRMVNGRMQPTYVSDAFIKFYFGGFMFYQAIEVMTSNNKINLEKYEDIFDSGEAQNFCDQMFPTIILIDDAKHSKEQLKLKHDIIVKQLGYDLKKFSKVFI